MLKQACPEEILKQVQNETFRVQHDMTKYIRSHLQGELLALGLKETIMANDPEGLIEGFVREHGERGRIVLEAFIEGDPLHCKYLHHQYADT